MYYEDEYLEHHGIKGQRWGVRRFQNADGSLTDVGAKRYGKNAKKYSNAYEKGHRKAYNKMARGVAKGKLTQKQMDRGLKELGMSKAERDYRAAERNVSKRIGTAALVGTFLAGPVVGVGVGAIAAVTPKGRDYCKQWNDTYYAYAAEQSKYKNK